jgi:hypothetical protein
VKADGAEKARQVRRVVTLVIMTVLATVNLWGWPYYAATAAERLRHPLRPVFKSSGSVGQALGLFAFTLFLFLWLYPLRKKFRALAFTGGIARWLDFHVVAGLLVPLVAAMHASWRFTGLIGLGYAAMLIVAASGVIGRYLYTRIPRTRGGVEMSIEELAHERRKLLGELCEATGLAPLDVERALAPAPSRGGGILGAFVQMIADDISRPFVVRRLVRSVAAAGAAADPARLRTVARMARREMTLEQRVRMLDGIHGVFRFWHVAHRPMAIMSLLAVAVHVAVAVAVGQTWFW